MKRAWNWLIAVGLGALAVFSGIQAVRQRRRAEKAEKRNDDIAAGQIKGHLDDAHAARHRANAHASLAKAAESKARARIEEIKRLKHESIADAVDRWNSGRLSGSGS